MSADRLRQAAALLREFVSAATAPEEMYPWGDRTLPPMPVSAWADAMDGYLGGTWGRLAGLLSPTVALAVADWLEADATLLQPGISIEDDQTLRYAGRLADAILAGVES